MTTGDEQTTIVLRKDTRIRLKNFAQKSETYDAVLNRLLNMATKKNK